MIAGAPVAPPIAIPLIRAMRIFHQLSFNSDRTIQRELAALGIDVAPSGLVVVEVDESRPDWPAVEAWIKRRDALDFVGTRFTEDEVANAQWLLMRSWHHGYPQPDEGHFGYREATYDLANYCRECGIGLKQKAPFQMKGEPKWGKRGILRLTWVWDEFFVTPQVFRTIFRPAGVRAREVLNRRGAQLETVVQLVVEEVVGVSTRGLEPLVCPVCNRRKFNWPMRGPFPAPTAAPAAAMVRSKAYFGDGAAAHHAVLASQRIVAALALHDVRGASFTPVAERGARASDAARVRRKQT